MTAKEFIPRNPIASFENGSDTNPLQNAATSMTCDRMIVDNEDTGHFPALHSKPVVNEDKKSSGRFACLGW
jgi:hypothetical protein